MLHSTVEVGTCTLVLGRVVSFSIRDEVMHEGLPTMAGLRPLSRLGGSEWGLPPEVVSLERPINPPD